MSTFGDTEFGMLPSAEALGSTEKPLTVSELTQRIKNRLESEFAWVTLIGEVSNFKPHSSGHFYFSLKDEGANISAVMFRGSNQGLKFKLADGMRVIAVGKLSVYPPRGSYQIVITRMEPDGLGALQMAFEQLKKKLEAEGLFSLERKRPLPQFPQRIGIVTSPTGAAIKDMLNVLGRRFASIPVTIYPVKVQGDGAAEEVAQGIRDFNRFFPEVDVLIVGRGGGSLEDLWAFNEEVVARAIYESKIPVISAVGHEIDFTIADFVADLRAPTPSAAAELVVSSREEALRHVDHLLRRLLRVEDRLEFFQFRLDEVSGRLERGVRDKLQDLKESLANLRERVQDRSPRVRVKEFQHRLEMFRERFGVTMRSRLENGKWQVERLSQQVRLLSPMSIMERGYSIVRLKKNSKIVKKAADVQMGDDLVIQLHKGKISARV